MARFRETLRSPRKTDLSRVWLRPRVVVCFCFFKLLRRFEEGVFFVREVRVLELDRLLPATLFLELERVWLLFRVWERDRALLGFLVLESLRVFEVDRVLEGLLVFEVERLREVERDLADVRFFEMFLVLEVDLFLETFLVFEVERLREVERGLLDVRVVERPRWLGLDLLSGDFFERLLGLFRPVRVREVLREPDPGREVDLFFEVEVERLREVERDFSLVRVVDRPRWVAPVFEGVLGLFTREFLESVLVLGTCPPREVLREAPLGPRDVDLSREPADGDRSPVREGVRVVVLPREAALGLASLRVTAPVEPRLGVAAPR